MIFGVSMKPEVSNGHQSIVSGADEGVFNDVLTLVDRLLVSHGVARSYLSEKSKCSPSSVAAGGEAVLIPLVVKQETESLKCAMEILLELYQDKSLPDFQQVTETKVL